MFRLTLLFSGLLSLVMVADWQAVSAGGEKKGDAKAGKKEGGKAGKKEDGKESKKEDGKGNKKNEEKVGGHKHPHIEKALNHLREAREQVISAIRAEERERKLDPTVHRELVKAMNDVNQAVAHARSALSLEKNDGGKGKKRD